LLFVCKVYIIDFAFMALLLLFFGDLDVLSCYALERLINLFSHRFLCVSVTTPSDQATKLTPRYRL
jgi:hypothetical protein